MITTIQLDSNLKEKLDNLKIHHRETYNELIARLLNACSLKRYSQESLIETIETLSNPEEMREIAEAMEAFERGERGTTLDELKKEFNL
jgi:PHD/YefM family antitoxin component YafN of YafNO toxin-antitoxin module